VKTQIIRLETHDDTISVKDKMDWSQTARVLLEWPQDGKVLQSRLDLVLLERYCSANGSQLALLTNDIQVIHQAEEAGIPVFRSRSQAQLQPWGRSFREFSRQEVVQKSQQPRDLSSLGKPEDNGDIQLPGWARILVFAAAVLAVLAIGGTLLPSATITLTPEVNQREITIPIQAIPGQDQVNLSGSIPARELQITIEDQASIPATGTLAVPAKYAAGEVVFTNLGENPVHIPENTILSTDQEDPLYFMTLSAGSAPEGKGSQIILPVQALEPGIQGNIAANTITRINQDFGADLSVNNPSPTSGGEVFFVPAPSEYDRSQLGIQLAGDMEERALAEAPELLQPGDILLSTRPEIKQVILAVYQPGPGAAGDILKLSSSIQYRVLYAAAGDLLSIAEGAVKALYPGGAYKPDLSTINLTQLTNPEMNQDQITRWELRVTWNEERVFNGHKIIQSVLGEDPDQAQRILQETLNLRHAPNIQVNPTWWSRIPALPFRINIVGISE
jgi:hypothetical protein